MSAIGSRSGVVVRSLARPRRWWALAALAVLALGAPAAPAASARQEGGSAFRRIDLVSDIPGMARVTDRNLVNPWGLAAGPSTPLWVADNGTDVSTLYTGGVGTSPPVIAPLVVRIPGGAPTGTVFNPTGGFVIHGGGESAPARFLFDSEAGVLSAWSPDVPPMHAAQRVGGTAGAIYKGLTLTDDQRGPRLFAADFHGAKIDVFDARFHQVRSPGQFTDPDLPAGFAPFNVQAIGDRILVAYAKQDEHAANEVAGPGLGFVDAYDTAGHLLRRLISRGRLDAPWGLTLAPASFGRFGGDLLVGNFGDGRIDAYDPDTGALEGQLTDEHGAPIQIDGLWTLRVGNGVFGTPETVVFSAGIADEAHGLLGEIVPAGRGR